MRNSIAERKPFIRSWLTRASILCLSLGMASAAFAQLEITEIMFNPLDENVWEWIEVRNTGGSAVDLNGYIGANLTDFELPTPNPAVTNTLAENTMIGPGEVAVLYDANYGSSLSPMANPNNFVDANFRSAWGLSASVPLIGTNFWPTLSNSTGSPTQSVGFWANATDYAMDITPVEDDPVNMPGVFTNRVTKFDNAQFSIDYSGASFPAVDGMSSITWSGNGSNSAGNQWVKSVAEINNAVTSVPVQVPGFINSDADFANPGIIPSGTPTTSGLIFTEIMYDPAPFDVSNSGQDLPWEWVEVYNSSGVAIDLTGWVLDDINNNAHSAANIAGGSVPAGGTAIFYSDELTDVQFRDAWERDADPDNSPLNLVAVSGWTTALMALNNSGDQIALWSSFASYSGDHNVHDNAVVKQAFFESTGFPNAVGASISPFDLSADLTDGGNWDFAAMGDPLNSFNPNLVSGSSGMLTLHAGGDVGSPGSFTVVAANLGDFDGDGDADGNDFLVWQRGNSPTGPLSPVDLAAWQGAYGNPLTAAVGAVPEPATWALLALALAPFAGRRK